MSESLSDHRKLLLAAGATAAAVAVGVGVRTAASFIVRGEVEDTLEKHGGQLVAQVLKAHGVEFVFTLVGGHISPILVACEQSGIRVIDTRHEVTTVFAADAVARMSGVPGVAAVTAGPGLTNTVTAIKNAQMAQSPVVLLGGAAVTLLKGRGALQDIDQMALFKPLCKYCATVTRVKDIVPVLRKAFQEAASGVPGPVFVEFPIDTLYPYPTVKKEALPTSKTPPKGIVPRFVNWYINNHLDALFADAFVPQDCSPLPVNVTLPSARQVRAAASIIRKAKKPVFILGSQATLPPVPASVTRAALESIGIPCFLGGMTRGLLGQNSPLHIRQQRRDALKDADVVVLLGAVADFRLGYGRVLNRRSKIISVNRDKVEMGKNSDMFWSMTQGINADVGTFIEMLAEELVGYKLPDDTWRAMLKDRDVAKEKKNAEKALEKTKYINPLKLFHDLEQLLPDNAILVADGGDFVGTAAYILRPRGPLTWLDPGAFGTLGVGAGFAIGAKLCRPDAEVWIVYGDGSLGYSVAEFDTYLRHNIPVIALIGNDACWSQIARDQVPMFKTDVACALRHTSYEIVAQGFGGEGYLLDDDKDIDETLKKAQSECKAGKAVLVNTLIGTTNFREGSISV